MFLPLFTFLAVTLAPAPIAAPLMFPTSSPQNPCPAQPSAPYLVDPPNIESHNGRLTLTLTLEGVVQTGGSQILCWVYSAPGNGKPALLTVPPTLNVKQGERLDITLVNTLPVPPQNVQTPPPIDIEHNGKPAMSVPMAMSTANPYALMCDQPQVLATPTPNPVTGRVYGYHRSPWNEANLHFHGLNTSPLAPGDDVTNVLLCPRLTKNAPPNVYHYVVDIPRNEPPGLYWYHPHAHGESMYQVFLGLTGAIVVHTATPSIPDQLTNHIVIVRDQPFLGGIAKYPLKGAQVGEHPSFADIRTQLAHGVPNFYRRPGGDPFQPSPGCHPSPPPQPPPPSQIQFQTDSLTVNGVPLPLDGNAIVGLPATKIGYGETQYWRLANTNANTTLDVVLYVNGKRQPLLVTARDGVPLITKNGIPTYAPVAMSDVFLMPASRFEFYLKGTVAGAQMVLRTRTIDTGCVGDTDLARNLLVANVGQQPVAQRAIVPSAPNPVPQRFSDLGSQTPSKQRTFVLTEYPRTDEPEPDFYITETSNPNAFEHPYRMTGPPDVVVKDGTVEQWTILNYTNEIHGFHIHQIHFMPTAGVDVTEGLGQLLDTVVVPHGGYQGKTFVPGSVTLLLDFREKNIVGTFVYHCHILEHEDNGMMARIQVVP